MNIWKKLGNYITRVPELNIVLFKIMGIGGICVSIIAGTYSIFVGGPLMVAVNFLAAVLAFLLLLYVEKTGKYVVGYIITEIVVFMILFSVLFLRGGGIEGALPYFFVFSLIFTFLMFQGRLLVLMETLMSGFYIFVIIFSVRYPQFVAEITDQTELVTEKIFGIFVSSLTLGAVILFYINEYKKQKRLADEAGAAKSTFLANMSHEIRTPINSVIGFNEMIMAESNDEKIREYATNVNRAGHQLLYVVNEVLDFSRLESGREVLQNENYCFEELIEGLISELRISAEKKNLCLELKIDGIIENNLVGDRKKLEQILTNLITNAIKYTDKGMVTVKVTDGGHVANSDESHRAQRIRFEVIDTGIGIDENDIDKLFFSYERVDLLKNNNIQGTGLGLAISKRLVNLMGGDIRVDSVYGEGSNFSFEILQEIGEERKENVIDKADNDCYLAPEANVLIVDDNEINRLLIKELMKHTLLHFDEAEDGYKSIELVANKHYDIILMDYMMPGMDGVEAMLTIREMEAQKGIRTPILVLTADVIDNIDKILISKGFDAYLSKPIDSKQLSTQILKFLPKSKVTLVGSEEKIELPPETIREYEKVLAEYDINMQTGMRYVSGSVDQYTGILRFFDENYRRARMSIEKAFEQKDIETMTLCFHSLKGNARNIGAVELYELARMLEKRCRAKDVEYIDTAIGILFLEWERAENGIRKYFEIFGLNIESNSMAENAFDEEETITDLIEEIADNVMLGQVNPAKKATKRLIDKLKTESKTNLNAESKIENSNEFVKHTEKLYDAIDNMEFDEAEVWIERLREEYGES